MARQAEKAVAAARGALRTALRQARVRWPADPAVVARGRGPARASQRLAAACGTAEASPPQLKPMLARGTAAEISPPSPRPPWRRSPTMSPLLALVGAPCLHGASGTSNFSFRQRLDLIQVLFMASPSTTLLA
ncbi:hypothetical protein PVAP13_3NG127001 [Panicum virgatum]|uniref:Uncharacterized protein n=1 Tax=Panicum virgatum TaxID=38727 RepID=A0A8T0UBJ8_PANVG|nr:hypothetical protein PVAP13_3NG127001 [Panicum virgatum]